MVELMDERFGKCSVEHVSYVINNLLHLVIVKYGVISLVLCISTRLQLVTLLTSFMKYFVIFHAIFHADLCNKSYIICLSSAKMRRWNNVAQTRACSKSVLGG